MSPGMSLKSQKQCCLILGAARGIGLGVAGVFAKQGFSVICVRRRPPKEAVASNTNITWRYFDATDAVAVAAHVADIEKTLGPIHVCIYNLGANIGLRGLAETKISAFDKVMKRAATGAFAAAQIVSAHMLGHIEAARKASPASPLPPFMLGFTGATASVRAVSGHVAHASGMYARRGLAQSLHHELGPKGIHVVHVVVDGAVNSPDTLGKLFPGAFKNLVEKKRAQGGVIEPGDVGILYHQLYSQPRSAWSFELDIRPWNSKPWWASTSAVPKL